MKARVEKAICAILLISAGFLYIAPPGHARILDPRLRNFVESYETHLPIFISSAYDFQELGFSGSGTVDDPYIIENLYIESENEALRIHDVDSSFIVRNCYMTSQHSTFALVDIQNARNITIEDCIFEMGMSSLRASDVETAVIRNNTIVSGTYGITLIACDEIEVTNNSISHCRTGMIGSSLVNSRIIENKIYGNIRVGVDISGISENNTFLGNRMGWNGGYAGYPANNNAVDDGAESVWAQNSWSDYSGYGDYEIEGASGSMDTTPRVLTDTAPPVIIQPANATIVEGIGEHNIFWNITDDFPFTYKVVRQNYYPSNREWIGNSITYSVGNLPVGSWNFTLVLTDVVGHSTNSSVLISSIPPLVTPELISTILVLVLVVSVIGINEFGIKRKKG